MDSLKYVEEKSAFENKVQSGRVMNTRNIIDPVNFLEQCKSVLMLKLGDCIYRGRSPVKMGCNLCCEYIIKKGDTKIITDIYHASTVAPLTLSDNFDQLFDNAVGKIRKKMDEFQERDSGKSLHCIKYLKTSLSKFDPMNGGSSYLDLPDSIKNKKAVVNVQNTDNKCFVWSLLSALFPVKKDAQRPGKYPQIIDDQFDLSDIHYPTPLADISKFEKKNNISVNVYGIEFDANLKKHAIVGPLHYTKNKKLVHVNLLYIQEGDQSHYAWIKNLSRLVSSQISKHKCAKFICDRCLQYFGRKDLLQSHKENCDLNDPIKTEMPSEDEKWLKFQNFMKKEPHPFVIYADTECLTVPIQTCQSEPGSSYTNAYQNHIPCAIGFQLVCSYDSSISFYNSFRGPDPAAWFIKQLKDVVEMVQRRYKTIAPLEELSGDNFTNAPKCHICDQPFNEQEEDLKKVRDHCHLSGKFRGAAHNTCNLNYQLPNYIPVFFHNLSGYDSHLFVKELGYDKQEIKLIPATEERYISISKKINGIDLRFLDSFRFMNSALDKLASYMDPIAFKLLREKYPDKHRFELMTQKGVYPYDYVNSWDRLDETMLPLKDQFYSKLKQADITDNDYKHAQNVWNTLDHKTLGSYTDLYLQTDVLLLADIFENFRDVCLKSYALDPAHYYTTPGLAWDCMLKKTDVQLELLTDINMYLFFERGIRGGISQCCNRYAKADNRYMTSYNKPDPETFLMYFDACNLYGYAMTQLLPHGSFVWLTDEQIEMLDIKKIPENGSDGYIFEVDLEYPKDKHNEYKDLPLCPERQAPPGSTFKKLMTTLYKKKNYILHYRNLQQCLSLKMDLKKVHKVLMFKQSDWLKKYIDFNTELRKDAIDDFGKNFYKLMNNAIYGKSMENIKKYRDIKLVSKWDGRGGARALIAKPNFKKITIFTDSLTAIELNKVKIKCNKPIYMGMVILDLSKHLMYDFHYNYIRTTYQNSKLLYMDTDSLIYEFRQDPYEQIAKDIHRFDTSDYPKGNKFKIPQANKKIVGLFKDENAGKIMIEFAGIRAKMYSFVLENEESTCKAKGVSRVVTNKLSINDYKNVLFHNTKIYKKQYNIISKKHDLFSVEQNKLTLSADDDKRYILLGSTDTLPWGHSSIDA